MQVLHHNKKANFNYLIEEDVEAGLVLLGSEVKSAREKKVNFTDAYVSEINGELFLVNANISEYKGANKFNHQPNRPRKLLLHKKEVQKLIGKMRIDGYSLIPTKLYLNDRNLIKVRIGIGKGKKMHDKRDSIKKRDEERSRQRGEE